MWRLGREGEVRAPRRNASDRSVGRLNAAAANGRPRCQTRGGHGLRGQENLRERNGQKRGQDGRLRGIVRGGSCRARARADGSSTSTGSHDGERLPMTSGCSEAVRCVPCLAQQPGNALVVPVGCPQRQLSTSLGACSHGSCFLLQTHLTSSLPRMTDAP